MLSIKVEKTKDYIVMCNKHLKEKNMSLKAKGLLSLMLSLPEDWNYSVEGLVSICKENETSIKSALDELKEFGYLVVKKKLPNETNSGRIEYEYIIYEQKQEGEKQGVENLGLEFLGVENLGVESSDLYNTVRDLNDISSLSNNLRENNNLCNCIDRENIIEIEKDKEERGSQDESQQKSTLSSGLFVKPKTNKGDLKFLLGVKSLDNKKVNSQNKKSSSILNNLKMKISKMNETESVKNELYRWLDILDANKKIVTSEQMCLALEYLDNATKDERVKIEAIKLASMNAYRNFNYTIEDAKRNMNKKSDPMHFCTSQIKTIEEVAEKQDREFQKYMEENPDKFKNLPKYF